MKHKIWMILFGLIACWQLFAPQNSRTMLQWHDALKKAIDTAEICRGGGASDFVVFDALLDAFMVCGEVRTRLKVMDERSSSRSREELDRSERLKKLLNDFSLMCRELYASLVFDFQLDFYEMQCVSSAGIWTPKEISDKLDEGACSRRVASVLLGERSKLDRFRRELVVVMGREADGEPVCCTQRSPVKKPSPLKKSWSESLSPGWDSPRSVTAQPHSRRRIPGRLGLFASARSPLKVLNGGPPPWV